MLGYKLQIEYPSLCDGGGQLRFHSDLQIGDGLDHVESGIYFAFCDCYVLNEAESSVYGYPEISIVVDHF